MNLYEDEPNAAGERKFPPPVMAAFLIVINVLVFILLEFNGGSENVSVLQRFGSLDPVPVWLGEHYRLFTAMFLHSGLGHILFNMFALYMLGRVVEPFYGHVRFLLIFLLAGLAGNTATQLFMSTPTVGASGAVLGLGGALLSRITAIKGAVPERSRMRFFILVLFLLALEVLWGLSREHVNNTAHIAGLLAGWWVSYAMVQMNAHKRWQRRCGLAVMAAFGIAFSMLAVFSVRFVLRTDDMVRMGDAMVRSNNAEAAVGYYHRALGRAKPPSIKRFGWRYSYMQRHFYNAQDFENTLLYGRRAATLDPGNPFIREPLERSYRELGQDKAADFEKGIYLGLLGSALAKNNNSPVALNNLAWSLAERDMMLDKAYVWALKANQLTNFSEPMYLDSLAWVLYKKREYEKAEQYLKLVVAAEHDPIFLFHYGAVLVGKGEEEAGRQFIEQAISQGLHWWELRQAQKILDTLNREGNIQA